MPEQDQQPQQPMNDGKVPMKDRVSGGYYRVPPADVRDLSQYNHGQQVSEEEYSAAVARQQKSTGKKAAPTTPTPQPTPQPQAPAKPSAGLNQAGIPINAPGGSGTNFVTGPRAAPLPPPVAGAGAGTPPPELPPGGVQSGTPGGRQAMTQQQQAAPTAGVMSQIASGLGKTVQQQAANLGGAFGVISPGMQQRIAGQPMTDVEHNTREAAEFLEWMSIPMGHGFVDDATEAIIKRFVPQITAKGVIGAQTLARILYNTTLGGYTAAAQGKDIKSSMIMNGVLSTLLEPLAKLSPMMLAKFLGAEAERGNLADIGEKAMGMTQKSTTLTRKQFADKAEKLYRDSVAETNALSQRPLVPGGQQQATTSIRQEILDVQDAMDNGPVNQRGKFQKLNKELIAASSTTDRDKLQATLKEWRTQRANFLKNQRAMRNASPTMRPVYMEAMNVASEKATRLRQEMRNLPANIDSESLNELRKTLADMAPWGKRDIEMSVADKKTRDVYNNIANLEKQVVPGSARTISDEDALHDLAIGAGKNLGLSGYIHSVSSPASIASSGSALLGYHFMGSHFPGLGLPGKVGGAIAGAKLGVPTVTAGMRALASRGMRGAAYGAAQELTPQGDIPTGDWSTKGKATPYTQE